MSALQFVLFGTLLVFSIIQAEQFIDVDSDDTLTDLTEEANFVENERFKKSTNTADSNAVSSSYTGGSSTSSYGGGQNYGPVVQPGYGPSQSYSKTYGSHGPVVQPGYGQGPTYSKPSSSSYGSGSTQTYGQTQPSGYNTEPTAYTAPASYSSYSSSNNHAGYTAPSQQSYGGDHQNQQGYGGGQQVYSGGHPTHKVYGSGQQVYGGGHQHGYGGGHSSQQVYGGGQQGYGAGHPSQQVYGGGLQNYGGGHQSQHGYGSSSSYVAPRPTYGKTGYGSPISKGLLHTGYRADDDEEEDLDEDFEIAAPLAQQRTFSVPTPSYAAPYRPLAPLYAPAAASYGAVPSCGHQLLIGCQTNAQTVPCAPAPTYGHSISYGAFHTSPSYRGNAPSQNDPTKHTLPENNPQ